MKQIAREYTVLNILIQRTIINTYREHSKLQFATHEHSPIHFSTIEQNRTNLSTNNRIVRMLVQRTES